MAMFPKIQSPCPYRADLAAIMDGDRCRACKRQVHDITDWSDAQRVGFLAACQDDVCVSYRLPVTAAAALAAVAAAAAPLPAAAECPPLIVEEMIIVGGITDPRAVDYVEADPTPASPELPVVYEDGASSPPVSAGG